MNVLIVGNSEINTALEREFAREGFDPLVLPDMKDFLKLKGEPGAYVAVTREKEIPASGVVITEPMDVENVTFGEGSTLSLLQPDLMEQLDTAEIAEPAQRIIFLLDFNSETPEYLTARALLASLELVQRKKKVVFLSRFVKTGASGMEKVYREARQSGVTFIKYERVDCSFADGQFTVTVFDGVLEASYTTPFLVAAGKEIPAINEEVIRKFRLAKTNQKQVNGNKYFLNPALTTRRGVYYYHPGLFEQTSELGMQKVLPTILGELQEIASIPKPEIYASVDKEKCAFCYSCYRVCPHAALEPDLENRAMKCTESACVACGTCVAICPGQAITLENEQEALRSVELEARNKGKCKVFCCENSAYPAFMEIADELGEDMQKLDVVKIPCGGRIGQEKIATAFASYDKVLLAVCIEDACRHMVGDKRACQHVEKMVATVGQMKLPGKRAGYIKASHAMKKVLVDEVRAFLNKSDNDVEG